MSVRRRSRVRRPPPLAAPAPTPRELGFRMPAEWEPHAATWLAWPHNQSDWPGKFGAIPWVFTELARAIVRDERVRLIVQSPLEQRQARALLKAAGVDLERIDFFHAKTDRSWTRDSLPLFVTRSGRRGVGEIGAVKWRFNGWARYSDYRKDEAAGARVARLFDERVWQPKVKVGRALRPVVLEGGAVDVDGQGTLLATDECLLDGQQARNPWLGRARTEGVLSDYLGAERVLWLPRGIQGDDTAGHVDDFVRFVAPGRVVLCEESNRRDPNHRALEAARERLSRARDARGRRIELVRLPMPAPLFYRGGRLPASYANFYLTSRSVLVPTFNDPRDREALGILRELFPGRRVLGIHSVDLVLGLGSLHCSTQQEPRGARQS